MQRALVTNLGRQWRQGHSAPLLHLLSDTPPQCDPEASDDLDGKDSSLGPSSSHGRHGSREWSLRSSASVSLNSETTTPFGVRHASFWPWRSRAPDSASTGQLSPTDDDLISPDAYFPLQETSFEAIAAIDQACRAIEIASISAAKGDAWFMASWFIHGIQGVHDATGLPWWASIAALNITMRAITFPLMIYSQKTTSKMTKFNHDLLHAKKLQEAMGKANTQEESNRLYAAFRSEYNKQVAKNGDPVKTALVIPGIMILNGFFFISIFNGVSKLMESKAPSLTVGGMLWFNDLTVPDPYYGLPIVCCVTTLAMVEYGMSLSGDQMGGTGQQQAQANLMKWFMRGASFMFLPAGGIVSAGTCILWVSNSVVAVTQGAMMRNDKFRRMIGLPTMLELKVMNAAVAEQKASESSGSKVATAPTSQLPVDIATGLPQLLNSPPSKARGSRSRRQGGN